MFKRRKPDDHSPEGHSPEGFEADGSPSPAGPAAEDVPAPGQNGSTYGGDYARERDNRNDWGVPPYRPAPSASAVFRPAPSQEPQAMGRAPFPAPPSPSAPPAPRPGTAIPPGPLTAGSQPGAPAVPAREVSEKRTLVVGRGISVQGTVQDAERLVVEGMVEASMIQAVELHVAPGGVFRGEVQVQEAELAGTIDGTLTASGSLIVRSTGRLLGTAKCRRLQVEDGGQVTGRLEMLPDQAALNTQPAADPFRPAPQMPEAAHSQPEDVSAP